MKKSTIIYLMMFICAFILPSYTIPQDSTKVSDTIHKQTSDSVVVRVRFQNPQVIVTDSRSSGVLEKKFDSTTTTNEKLISVMDTLSKDLRNVVALQQEGRCESAMDRITQCTGYSEVQVKTVFAQERTLNMLYGIFTLIFIIACLTIYFTSFTRYRGLNAIQLLVCCLVYAGVLLLTKFLFPSLFGVDYQQFFQLLKHVPL